jgi:hypothetical protein
LSYVSKGARLDRITPTTALGSEEWPVRVSRPVRVARGMARLGKDSPAHRSPRPLTTRALWRTPAQARGTPKHVTPSGRSPALPYQPGQMGTALRRRYRWCRTQIPVPLRSQAGSHTEASASLRFVTAASVLATTEDAKVILTSCPTPLRDTVILNPDNIPVGITTRVESHGRRPDPAAKCYQVM